MQYVFLAPDGNEYGPVDSAVLQQWIAEGRVLPQNSIRIVQTGQVVPAASIVPAAHPYDPGGVSHDPYPGGYNPASFNQGSYRGGSAFSGSHDMYGVGFDSGKADVQKAWMYMVAGIFCCPLTCLAGAYFGYQGYRKGNAGGMAAMIVNLAMLVLTLMLFSVIRSMLGM